MTKLISLALAILASLGMASDVFRARALREWSLGEDGAESIRLAATLNPYSFEVRLDEIESLWDGYSKERKLLYLHETVLISRSLVTDYPGNTLGWSVYSSALIFEATHGGNGFPIDAALTAISLDPISVTTAERAMFLLAAKRKKYETFKSVGIARSRLTREPLRMACELDGKSWMEHR